jgi:CheY-like chemotaxis protein
MLTERVYAVQLFESGIPLLEALKKAVKNAETPAFLIDMIMPRMDGSGILGGIEILEHVKQNFPGLTTLVMSDHPNPEAEKKIRRLGVPMVLSKPKKSRLAENAGADALRPMIDEIERFLIDLAVPPPPLFNFGAELLKEIGESGEDNRPRGPQSPGLHLLKGMLQELSNPSLGGGIILLVLRFASELMNRAVIFLVKEDAIVGLGQFGIELTGDLADVRIRRMRIPRAEESIFTSILREMSPRKVSPGKGPLDRYLLENLGGGNPQEIFLGPIVSEGKVVAIIYGDNLPEKKPIGDTESFEIFLSQAGLAMEKALLERRLRGKESV